LVFGEGGSGYKRVCRGWKAEEDTESIELRTGIPKTTKTKD
jgi:hypothetical protein